MKKIIKITEFAKRHFNGNKGTQIRSLDINNIEKLTSNIYNYFSNSKNPQQYKDNFGFKLGDFYLFDGYADFCKLLVIKNTTDTRTGTSEITNENYQWLRTDIEAREEWELPVPVRYFDFPIDVPKAEYLVFVLYSNEHLKTEHKIRTETKYKQAIENNLSKEELDILNPINNPYEFEDSNVDFGIVSIMAQMEPYEEPMHPNTIIRNHLGKEFGGSGAPIDREYYKRSVEFWRKYAIVK